MVTQSQSGGSSGFGSSYGSTPTTHEAGPMVDARSLGLAAFATTTFVFGLSYTTIWSTSTGVASTWELALVFGGAIQVLAGIWAFGRRQAFPAVTFCSYGAFYVAYYLYLQTGSHLIGASSLGTNASTASAVFLLAWLILSSYILLASLKVSPVAGAVYFFWWLAYLLLVIGEFLGNLDVTIGGGAAAIASAGFAWYASGAMLVNETSGKTLLPLVGSGKD